jgi:hypothetical protein
MIIRQILRLIIYYLMPLIFISIFYGLIAKTLLQTKVIIYSPNTLHPFQSEESHSLSNNIRYNRDMFSNNQTTNPDKRTRQQLRTRHKIAKVVLLLCLVFFICWLPKQIHDLYWYVNVMIYLFFVYLIFQVYWCTCLFSTLESFLANK